MARCCLCEHCIEEIRSRGEQIFTRPMVSSDLTEEEYEKDIVVCDFCEEEYTSTEMYVCK